MRLLPDTRGLPRPYWFLFAGTFLNKVGGFVIILLAFYLRDERHLSVETSGLIVALYGAGSFVAGPIGGALTDRIGRRATMIGSQIAGAAAMLHLGLARDPVHIAVASFLVGVVCDAVRPALSAAVADLVPPADRKRAYGLLYWAVNLGFAAAALLAGLVASVSFWLVFVIDAATSVAFAAVVAAFVPETKPADAPVPDKEKGQFPYSDGVFMAYVLTTFAMTLVFAQGFAPLPLDMTAHGVSAATFGQLIAINGVLIVLLQPVITEMLSGVRNDRALAAAALLIGVGMGVNAFARTPLPYAIGIIVWTAGEIVMAPVGPAVAADLAPAAQRGAYQGAYQLAWGGSMFVAPLVGSLLLGRYGSLGLWGACFACSVVAAVGQLAIGRAVRRRVAALAGAT